MSKVKEGEIVVCRKKIWTIGYADYIVLITSDRSAIKEMLKRLERYLERKKCTLNAEKTRL